MLGGELKLDLDLQREKMRKKFSTIKWNFHPCGRGSTFENTELTRALLERITKQYNIQTVSDAGAGDLSWIHATNWDVRHPDVIEFDVTKDVLPKTDLIICRHVLNHLGPDLAKEARDRFEESGSKYLLLTCTKIDYLIERWKEPLEFESETFQGGRTWNYGLWLMNED
jgi:hypothetical protein